ncbi:chromosomal replication initiator protein DnaA [Candidatus Babeliales bacterium]|nr:chromosomal replication initiator protein DnaA [Candidatus Babeliales bacterium]MBY0353525.1 chromosomal replication initiator protein DnaA [Candidatus Babeliales bacterium]
MQVIWDEFLKIIKEEAGSQIVETWFKAVILQDWNPTTQQVILKAPNQFVRTWIQEHYEPLLKMHLGRLLHAHHLKIFFTCKDSAPTDERKETIIPAAVDKRENSTFLSYLSGLHNQKAHYTQPAPTQQATQTSAITVQQTGPATSTDLIIKERKKIKQALDNLNENYTFESFVVGPSNSLAHAAAFAICENLGKVYNPCFIYGGTGLGKTHLLHAIGNEVRRRNPASLVRYETSDHFINEFINSIRFDRSHQFREKYLKIDLLLVDDIQFLSNKEQTQEMFFHIFNALYEKNKQIILSSDTFPKEIKGLQSRIKSRMEWGLVADIQTPDLETKIAILKKKAFCHAIELPDDVADFIASRVQSNIRELEGALIRVSAFAGLINKPICLEMARKVLLNLNEKKKEGIVLDNIMKVIAKDYDVSVNDIKSKKRLKNIANARQIAFYLMKKLSHCSLQSIGSFIGGRDHSTVIHAINKVEDSLAKDTAFKKKLQTLEQKILMY